MGHALNLVAIRAEPDWVTGETTSHLTKAASCQVIAYSHSTWLSKDENQVAGYVEAQESIHTSTGSLVLSIVEGSTRTDSWIMSAGSIRAKLTFAVSNISQSGNRMQCQIRAEHKRIERQYGVAA